MKRIASPPKSCGSRRSVETSPLRWRFGEQFWHRAAADIIDARVVDALAVNLDQYARGQIAAIIRAEHHREVGALTVPGCLEFRTQRDFCRTLRAANFDRPTSAGGRLEMHVCEFCAQGLSGLFECKAPVVEHVVVASHADAAGSPIKGGVLIRMQPNHVAYRQCNTTDESGHECRSGQRA